MRVAALFMVICASMALGGGGSARADGTRVFHDASATGERFPASARPVAGQSVIGNDDREQINDTTAFPFSAIAYLELEDFDRDVLGSCTATFIGPNALLTAAHCLWDFEAEDWVEEHLRVVPGKDGEFEPFGFQYASDWWVPDAYVETGLAEWDWGIIKLPTSDLAFDTGWLTMAVLDTAVLSAPGFEPAIVGYPANKPFASMWAMTRPAFLTVTEFILTYDIDTAPGQSGSAIWSAAEGPYLGLVVGIHTQGGAVNSGSRIDQELLENVLEGCLVMECTIALDEGPRPIPEPQPEPVPGGFPFRAIAVAVARE